MTSCCLHETSMRIYVTWIHMYIFNIDCTTNSRMMCNKKRMFALIGNMKWECFILSQLFENMYMYGTDYNTKSKVRIQEAELFCFTCETFPRPIHFTAAHFQTFLQIINTVVQLHLHRNKISSIFFRSIHLCIVYICYSSSLVIL